MHQALYRSFRPETFEGLLGQEHIIKILRNQIHNGTVGHAYLFCGTRGTGKTTTARILAKGVNCTAPQEDRPCGTCENCISIRDGIFLDVIEIDAASHNGVENIRELRESVKYPPVAGRCKVYIIDEVHMLSTGAFNALLKTLEEPPANIMFILATTEPQKLPATVLSRCLRLDFHRVPEKQLREGMRDICKSLDVKISDSALGIIAANGDGSVRDSLSILDQCIAGGDKEISREDVIKILGTSGEEVFIQLTDMMDQGRVADALLLLDQLLSEGIEVKQLMKDWIGHYRNLMMTKFVRNPEDLLNVSEENVERIREQSMRIDLSSINDNILELARTLTEAKWSTQPRILLELCMVRLASGDDPGRLSTVSITQSAGEKVEKKVREKKTEPATKREGKPKKAEDAAEIAEIPEVPEVSEETPDLEQIWRKVMEEGECEKGSLSMLRRGGRLVEIKDGRFRLELANDMAVRYAKDNADYLKKLMKKYTGKELEMDYSLADRTHREPEKQTAEELASLVGNGLNINVEVK